jgi:ribonuclease HI
MTSPVGFSLYTDGSAQPNPGPCGCGAVLIDAKGEIQWTLSEFLGEGTNNIGELFAILRGITRSMEMGIQHLHVYSDSELSVELLKGEKQTKKEHLLYLVQRIQKTLLKKPSMKVEFSWVKAHAGHKWNEMADHLANSSLPSSFTSLKPKPSTSAAPNTNAASNAPPNLAQDGPRILLRSSFAEKDEVKKLGARWDPSQKSWWVADTPENQKKFSKWIQK